MAFLMYDLPLAGSSARAMHSGLSGLTLWHSRWGRHSLFKRRRQRCYMDRYESWRDTVLWTWKLHQSSAIIPKQHTHSQPGATKWKLCRHSGNLSAFVFLHIISAVEQIKRCCVTKTTIKQATKSRNESVNGNGGKWICDVCAFCCVRATLLAKHIKSAWASSVAVWNSSYPFVHRTLLAAVTGIDISLTASPLIPNPLHPSFLSLCSICSETTHNPLFC